MKGNWSDHDTIKAPINELSLLANTATGWWKNGRVIWSNKSPFQLHWNNNQVHLVFAKWKIFLIFFLMSAGNCEAWQKIMVWECFSWNGVSSFYRVKGIIKKEQYREILIHHMRPSAKCLNGNNFIFQHDNDLKHTSNLVKNYLQNQRIEVLCWPPQFWFEPHRESVVWTQSPAK